MGVNGNGIMDCTSVESKSDSVSCVFGFTPTCCTCNGHENKQWEMVDKTCKCLASSANASAICCRFKEIAGEITKPYSSQYSYEI